MKGWAKLADTDKNRTFFSFRMLKISHSAFCSFEGHGYSMFTQ